MSDQYLRSNNPFAQDAEQEIQSQISDSLALSRQSSINRRTDPTSSRLEDSSMENAAVSNSDSAQQNNSSGFSGANNSNSSDANVPTIQIDHQSADQVDGEGLTNNGSRRPSVSMNNGSVHEWQQIEDTNPDEPPPAYSEVDPISPSNGQQPSTNIYERPAGEPPRSPSRRQDQEPSAPPPPPRPFNIDTQFAPPAGPPPASSPSQVYSAPDGPPPSHLAPDTISPSLPPRPTSPRLPPRPAANVPRRNVYPGASGATYSTIGAPPLPNRR